MQNHTKLANAYLMFKSTDESVDLLISYFADIAIATQFPETEALLKYMESVREAISNLIVLQLITQVEVCFAQESFHLVFYFCHDAFAENDIDLSLLEMLSITAEHLTIRFYTNDEKNARLLGFQEIEALNIHDLSWELVVIEETHFIDNDDDFPLPTANDEFYQEGEDEVPLSEDYQDFDDEQSIDPSSVESVS